MYSKFVLAIRFCSVEMAILVRKWPMADCYFKLWVLHIVYADICVSMYVRTFMIRSLCLGIIMTISPSMLMTLPCECTNCPSHTSTISPGASVGPVLLTPSPLVTTISSVHSYKSFHQHCVRSITSEFASLFGATSMQLCINCPTTIWSYRGI